MGSSYRDELKRGGMDKWGKLLSSALENVLEVERMVYYCCNGDDGQFDNAMDDGRLQGRLYVVSEILATELPEKTVEEIKKRISERDKKGEFGSFF